MLSRALPSIDLPSIDFPQVGLPDALNSLAAFATQLQTTVATALSHPVLAVAIIIVSIGLLQLIADLVKRAIKASLKLIITLPLSLSQWIWKRATTASDTKIDDKAKVSQLLDRLETLRTEQDQIMTELKELLQASGTANQTANQTAINESKPSLPPANPASPPLQKSAESPQS